MTKVPEMMTPAEIQNIFETDRPFSKESRAQSLGRLAWLRSRHEAEFLLYLAKLRVPAELAGPLMGGLFEILNDYQEFVHIGLKQPGETAPSKTASHPSLETLSDLVFESVESVERTAARQDFEHRQLVEEVADTFNLDDGDDSSAQTAEYIAGALEFSETGDLPNGTNIAASNFFSDAAGLSDESLFNKLREIKDAWPDS